MSCSVRVSHELVALTGGMHARTELIIESPGQKGEDTSRALLLPSCWPVVVTGLELKFELHRHEQRGRSIAGEG